MKSYKIALATLVVGLISAAPSFAQAQSLSQISQRRGAVAGAIIGGVIGAQNDETLAGIAIGGLVGGVAGRQVGRTQQSRYQPYGYNNGYGYNKGYQTRSYKQPVRYTSPRNVGYKPVYKPGYGYNYNGYNRGGYNRGYGPSYRGW